MDHLAEHRIPVECCPISNLRTGAVAAIAAHPIREFFDRGMLVSVNTDDPGMFGNSLADDYAALVAELGFTRQEIVQIVLAAVESSWAPDDRKAALSAEIRAIPGG
jgi:adenosine deaminase